MSVTHETLRAAIIAVRDGHLSSGRFTSARKINAGHCADFAGEVTEEMGLDAHAEEPFEIGIDNLMMPSEDGDPTGFDRELLASHWPDIAPPDGMDWDDCDALASDANFSSGTHVWLCLNGRHYDAEAPDGVANPFDLPFFQRVVGSWLDERPSPRP